MPSPPHENMAQVFQVFFFFSLVPGAWSISSTHLHPSARGQVGGIGFLCCEFGWENERNNFFFRLLGTKRLVTVVVSLQTVQAQQKHLFFFLDLWPLGSSSRSNSALHSSLLSQQVVQEQQDQGNAQCSTVTRDVLERFLNIQYTKFWNCCFIENFKFQWAVSFRKTSKREGWVVSGGRTQAVWKGCWMLIMWGLQTSLIFTGCRVCYIICPSFGGSPAWA